MPGVAVKPRSTTVYSTDLSCDVRRRWGWQAYCACGWEGPQRRDRDAARLDAQGHRQFHIREGA